MSKVAKSMSFLREVLAELKKIVWPSRAELIGSSIIVCMLAIFCAIVLGGLDSAFAVLVRKIIIA